MIDAWVRAMAIEFDGAATEQQQRGELKRQTRKRMWSAVGMTPREDDGHGT
jgi:hypothetical protein